MKNMYTGELVRLRPFASLDEALNLVAEIHLAPVPAWGEQWTPTAWIADEWEKTGILGEESVFAVERLDTGELIGYECAEHPTGTELTGWVATYIRKEHQRRGFGVEAKRLALRFLFENQAIDNVSTVTLSNHSRALRGLELSGMREEGRLKGCTISEGRWVDKVFFTITRSEWEAREQ